MLTLSNLGSKILAFLLIPLYTSVLSTEQYGVFDLAQTTVSLCIPILSINISSAALRFRILSSATFGVYLIHNNNYFNDLVFKNIFINVPTDNVIIFILCFYFSIASVYATCTVIELLRIRFFCAIKGCFVLASKTKSNLLDN